LENVDLFRTRGSLNSTQLRRLDQSCASSSNSTTETSNPTSEHTSTKPTKPGLNEINEIPDQVIGTLTQGSNSIVNTVMGEVACVCDRIRFNAKQAPNSSVDSVVKRLGVIPEMVQESFDQQSSWAKSEVRQRVDETIAEIEKMNLTTDEVVKEMRAIPSHVDEIAMEAMTAASQISFKKAQKQIAYAREACSGSNILAGADGQILALLPNVPHTTLQAATTVAVDTVERAVAATFGEAALSNQVIADSLLRAKAKEHGTLEIKAACEENKSTDLQEGNLGSVGHPELCARPCLYFPKGECSNGQHCNFCHLPHPRRAPHLDRRNRELIKKMSIEECAAVVIPVIHDQMRALGVEPIALLALGSFAADLGCANISTQNRLPSRRRRQLHDSLSAMSIRLVLALLSRKAATLSQRQAIHNFTGALQDLVIIPSFEHSEGFNE